MRATVPEAASPARGRLSARDVTLAHDRHAVSEHLSLDVPDGSFTVLVGPNASGKSTLLAGLARVLRPRAGTVLLDGADIARTPTRMVARTLGLLPQSPTAPDGITVADLVSRGRHPYQGMLRRWSAEDDAAVDEALRLADVLGLAGRGVDELSGGQRQRVWLAVALAQQTPLLLLDEPTTYLDIAHQVEVLDLLERLNADGRTLVVVLHDLNQAARYATHLVAMRDGAVVATGHPEHVVTAELVERVFGLPVRVVPDPETGTPMVVPRRVARAAGTAGTGAR